MVLPFFNDVQGFVWLCFFLFLLQATLWAPRSTGAADVTGGAAFGTSSCQQPQEKGPEGSSSPGTPGAVSQQFFLGQGMDFCCATLPGGGQAAGAGVSQELFGYQALRYFGVLARAEVGV